MGKSHKKAEKAERRAAEALAAETLAAEERAAEERAAVERAAEERAAETLAAEERAAEESAAAERLPGTREELLELHRETRKRRNGAPHGSEEHRAAIDLIGRIEVEVARIERAMDPPRG